MFRRNVRYLQKDQETGEALHRHSLERQRKMKLLVTLALLTAVSTAVGYKCFKCSPLDPKPCKRTVDCQKHLNITGHSYRCFKSSILGVVTQGCVLVKGCKVPTVSCCNKHLCNSAPLSLAPLLLLLGLPIFITLYLNQD